MIKGAGATGHPHKHITAITFVKCPFIWKGGYCGGQYLSSAKNANGMGAATPPPTFSLLLAVHQKITTNYLPVWCSVAAALYWKDTAEKYFFANVPSRSSLSVLGVSYKNSVQNILDLDPSRMLLLLFSNTFKISFKHNTTAKHIWIVNTATAVERCFFFSAFLNFLEELFYLQEYVSLPAFLLKRCVAILFRILQF